MTARDAPLADAAEGGLARRGIAAALWNYLGNGARAGSQLVVAVVLARLLGPATFGTVAVGWLVFGVGSLFGELGFGAAIVQRPVITRRDVDFAFTMQIASSILISILIAVAAPWIAHFFGQPEAANVVRAMGASLIVRAFGQTAGALLQRELRFRSSQLIGVLSYTIGFGAVGIALAWLGLGAWALVGAQFAQTAGASLALIVVARRRLAFALRPTHPDIARTGLFVIAANASSWAILNIDSVIVGHVAGAVTLGLYNRATALASMPGAVIVSGLQGVLLAAASRVQTDTAKLHTAFFGSVAVFVLLAGSALATIALVPETVIVALLGAAWRGAVPFLPPLALALILNGMLAFAGPVLTATGNVRKEAQAQWTLLPVMIPIVWYAAQVSIVAAAWGVVVCYALRLALLYARVNESVAFRRADAARALLPPLAAAAVTAAATRLIDEALPPGIGPATKLAVDAAAAGLALAATSLALRTPLARGPLGQVLRAAAIVPRPLRGWLFA